MCFLLFFFFFFLSICLISTVPVLSSDKNHTQLNCSTELTQLNHTQLNGSTELTQLNHTQLNGRSLKFIDDLINIIDPYQVIKKLQGCFWNSKLLIILKEALTMLHLMDAGDECKKCTTVVDLLQFTVHHSNSVEAAIDRLNTEFTFLCESNFTSRVCKGMFTLYANPIVQVIQKMSLLPDQICSFLLDQCPDVEIPSHEWNIALPSVPKPPLVNLTRNGTTLKVLQLSDTHFDVYYQEGSNADCGEPLCCRVTSGKVKSDGAGRWGDYRKCGTPKRTIEHMLDHIRETHTDIAYIIWTGDLPPHDIWNQTRQGNLDTLKACTTLLADKFPNIPIYPVVGNHESVPVNSFLASSVKEYSISWLYDELDTQWSRWIPASKSNMMRTGGFYSILARPGLRIISLNTNYCNRYNFWLLLNSTDPMNQLQWLVSQLQTAENTGEKVHIIGHIPPGTDDCLKVWSRNYYKIINRYEGTVAAQFFGHTHTDEFELFYEGTRATSIAYIAPSISTYDNLNPGYRLYNVDGDRVDSTRSVLDHETWILALREANQNPSKNPSWYKLYSAKSAYNMSSLLPQDWHELVLKLTKDRRLFDEYYKNYWKDSPVRPSCDEACRKEKLCALRSGKSRARKVFCPNNSE